MPEGEHLLACERYFDRAFQFPRRQDGQQHMDVRTQPRSEPSADERRHDAEVVFGEAEYSAEIVPHILNALRLVVHGQLAVGLADDGRRERLHRVVMLERTAILRVELRGRGGEGSVGIAARLGQRRGDYPEVWAVCAGAPPLRGRFMRLA